MVRKLKWQVVQHSLLKLRGGMYVWNSTRKHTMPNASHVAACGLVCKMQLMLDIATAMKRWNLTNNFWGKIGGWSFTCSKLNFFPCTVQLQGFCRCCANLKRAFASLHTDLARPWSVLASQGEGKGAGWHVRYNPGQLWPCKDGVTKMANVPHTKKNGARTNTPHNGLI